MERKQAYLLFCNNIVAKSCWWNCFFFLHCSHAELSAIELSKAQNFDGIMNVDASLSPPFGGFAIAEHIYFSLIKAHTRDSKRNALISTEKAHKTHTHTRTTFHEAYPCTKTARRIFMSCMQSKFWVIRCRIIWTVFSLCLSLCTFQEYSSWMCVCVCAGEKGNSSLWYCKP